MNPGIEFSKLTFGRAELEGINVRGRAELFTTRAANREIRRPRAANWKIRPGSRNLVHNSPPYPVNSARVANFCALPIPLARLVRLVLLRCGIAAFGKRNLYQ